MEGALPGAASASLAHVLNGPVRIVTVTASLSRALYVTTGDPDVPALCVAAADAVRVPCAVLLGPGVPVPTVTVGSPARLGEGRVEFTDSAVAVARWWRASRPQVPLLQIDDRRRTIGAWVEHTAPTDASRTADTAAPLAPPADVLAAAAALEPGLAGGHLGVAAALGSGLAGGDLGTGVRALLGRGEGLTPLGDDILAGILVTLADHEAGRVMGSMVAEELASRPGATTAVSAALLTHATRGECIPELAAVLTDPLDRLDSAVEALLRVGHSSGGGLLHGVRMGLKVLTGPKGLVK
ncbi:DUF2877 domain-containing protein [Cryptosporangium sp. NPDC048952]|uniref:oxamate carbamoyltransferase subunit AllH family protein n=1 Tax=Cryptosporangium sp. NPDC048952 TaxID=3363961 RepID=UPI003723C693